MREHPWHMRRVTHRHLHDQRNLLDLHFLTHSWVKEEDTLDNPFEKEPSLEDDTTPEDVLLRLEQGVREAQVQMIRRKLTERAQLAEFSQEAGRKCAAQRWGSSEASEAPETVKNSSPIADKRPLLLALYHCPLGGRLGKDAFIVRRALVSEVCVELLQCPHELLKAEADAETIDALCQQQFHWLSGYLKHLNPALTPSISRTAQRCAVQW